MHPMGIWIMFNREKWEEITSHLEENADIQIYSYGNSIYLNNNTDSETLVSVYNITGRQIYQDRVGAGSQHTFTINAPTGLYIVKALTGKSITSRKVFIW
jgi:UDP-galactopyranose mutase